jgi:uncharacterized membrane protein YhfC
MDDITGEDDDSPPPVRKETVAWLPAVGVGAVDYLVRLEVLERTIHVSI